MNPHGATAQPLIMFYGPVQVHHGRGAVSLLLRGRETRGAHGRSREFTELVFAAAEPASLPELLHDAQVFGPEQGTELTPGLHRYRIEAAAEGAAAGRVAWSSEVLARGMQLHREAQRAFYGAVPGPTLPYSRRLGWLALLWLLRVPGAARMLARLRGAR